MSFFTIILLAQVMPTTAPQYIGIHLPKGFDSPWLLQCFYNLKQMRWEKESICLENKRSVNPLSYIHTGKWIFGYVLVVSQKCQEIMTFFLKNRENHAFLSHKSGNSWHTHKYTRTHKRKEIYTQKCRSNQRNRIWQWYHFKHILNNAITFHVPY